MFLVHFLLSFALQTADIDNTYHAAASRTSVSMQTTGRTFVSSENPENKASKPWNGHFAAQNFDKPVEKTALKTIRKNLQAVVLALPHAHTSALKSLEVRNTDHVSRGLANSKKIILNTGNIDTDAELKAVFIHELGHVVDLGRLKGQNLKKSEFKDGKRSIWSDDPSLAFYRLSWANADARKAGTSKYDFVSGYSMSNPFEDFAESYLFYRLHGAKFRAATTKSEILGKKYAFMRDQVFGGEEFQTDTFVKDYIPGLIWDVTLLGYAGLN